MREPHETGGSRPDVGRSPGGEADGGTALTGGDEVAGPGADAGVTSGTKATETGANLAETEATRESAEGGRDAGR